MDFTKIRGARTHNLKSISVFAVKVGAASGTDDIFSNDEFAIKGLV